MGVMAGIRSAVEHVFGEDSLDGRSVLVQGLGGVVGPLARVVAAGGATVLISDAMPGRAQSLVAEIGATVIAPEDTYRTVCDVFAPCAIGGILNERSIPNLQCRVVAGSANNQLEREADAELLHERGHSVRVGLRDQRWRRNRARLARGRARGRGCGVMMPATGN